MAKAKGTKARLISKRDVGDNMRVSVWEVCKDDLREFLDTHPPYKPPPIDYAKIVKEARAIACKNGGMNFERDAFDRILDSMLRVAEGRR